MPFSETLVARDARGRFAEGTGSIPEVALPYPHGTSLVERYEARALKRCSCTCMSGLTRLKASSSWMLASHQSMPRC